MQGMFIGDDHTPPECLRRYLEGRLKTKVSVLNTGHLGYSPEQYYYSLLAYAERFRPDFVVVSLCPNDFGDIWDVLKGQGDWEEAKYWLDKITSFCRTRELPHLFVPVPVEPQMLGRRRAGFYPGTISNILEVNSLMMFDPTDDFINAHSSWSSPGNERAIGPRAVGCSTWISAMGTSRRSARTYGRSRSAAGSCCSWNGSALGPKIAPAKTLTPAISRRNGKAVLDMSFAMARVVERGAARRARVGKVIDPTSSSVAGKRSTGRSLIRLLRPRKHQRRARHACLGSGPNRAPRTDFQVDHRDGNGRLDRDRSDRASLRPIPGELADDSRTLVGPRRSRAHARS